jgi:branched-chain amino acid transport system permease protein
VDGLVLGSIYALIALGYTLVYGVLRLINFAHSEVFMIGIFTTLGGLTLLGRQPGDPALTGVALLGTFTVVLLLAMLASGVTAVIIERVAYRPLRRRNAPRLAALITAIGISLFLQELFALRFSREFLPFPRFIAKRELFEFQGANVRNDKVLVFVSAILLMVLLDQFVRRSRLGRGIRATAQNPEVAALMGVNIDRVVLLTFLVGGILAGAAGTLFAVFIEQVRFNIGFIPGIKAFTAAVLGGIGNIRGALLGGMVLGLLENHGAAILGAEWKDVFSFGVLVLVLMFRPTGLLGESLGRGKA